MTNADGQAILANLSVVGALRARRREDPDLAQRIQALKQFQHARFERSYADLLADPGQRDAARFFLEELYGPHDFGDRDAQFARIVPALVRLFPAEIVATVRTLSDLHALSEQLDASMVANLPEGTVTTSSYAEAWRATGQAAARQKQIDWMMQIGRALERYTRKPLLRHSLRLMRGPARAAGLGTLQQFLERGFDTFRGLARSAEFLDLIAARERQIARWLFDAELVAPAPPGFD
jgi:hypothetical protein